MKVVLRTNGSGLWSSKSKTVQVTNLECRILKSDNEHWGELMVYFDTDTWNISEDGLIYTDDYFLSELCNLLTTKEFSKEGIMEVGYSEQGMQGVDYVSFDVGEKFCKQWVAKYPQTEIQEC